MNAKKVELSVEKQDAETGKALKGATFGLYNKEAISSGDKVIVKSGHTASGDHKQRKRQGSVYTGSSAWQILCERAAGAGGLCIFR